MGLCPPMEKVVYKQTDHYELANLVAIIDTNDLKI